MIIFSLKQEVKNIEKGEQAEGKLAQQFLEDKLMRSVLKGDKKTIDKAQAIEEAINKGIGIFNPDMMFEQIVKNYSMAKRILGEKIIRLITGYDPEYVERNIRIPEFQRELKRFMQDNFEQLKKEGILEKEGNISQKAVELVSLTMYYQEIDHITPKTPIGKKETKQKSYYGEKYETRNYKKYDRYRDIAIRKTIRKAIKRQHKTIEQEDLISFERQKTSTTSIIYALDASSSMKGEKIEMSKKAGVALAYNAIKNKDKVGLVVFGSEIKEEIPPTEDFNQLLNKITTIRATKQTDFKIMIKKSIELFSKETSTKHLILLTDAMPTVGEAPKKETMEYISIARNNGITISVIGINLNKEGEELAKEIVELGNGKLYNIHSTKEIDKIILEDYYDL